MTATYVAPIAVGRDHADVRRSRVLLAMVAVAAALPSLIACLLGPTPIMDDWGFASAARLHSWSTFGFGQRPGQAVVHVVEFTVFGTHPVAPLLLLALANAASAVMLWRLVRRLAGSAALATLTAMVWALIPNRSSTHLWASTLPTVGAILLLLGAALVAARPVVTRREAWLAIGLLAASCLTYEGGALLAVAVLVILVRRSAVAERIRVGVVGGVVLVAALGWIATHTPKTVHHGLFAHAASFVTTMAGSGVLPSALARFGPLLIVAVAVGACGWLTGRCRGVAWTTIRVGGGATVLGTAVFAATSFQPTSRGLFDRGNAFADVGWSAVVAGIILLVATALTGRSHRLVVATAWLRW